ncbi:sigma-70 family RNA polymerase sigma factor [Actinophytocola algeriensis]|uniref:RNA polymerase sigma factor n=1 Tax=Actinophytocola algeriensis TaxID=1768010 RepID=A0A7W7PZQ4_9PSEU|nr:sigma-70 family RNA polymerase sigma factor [Actinophytocola algeriensis]MBB4904330.1 RNA polymerase sigma-70 factor (ECF subfamily) [Actinophytocola algeriensis]MBE1476812.1 RNA polymerase sigma-70 factor (ECF subfamily) [Actinophytocola algeriensis]
MAVDADPDFLSQADPYRRELLAHCYRMLGSVHDAEDLVQETMLRAWRGYDRFEGRSSLRTWLYRIATTQCLTALESRGRRPLPTGLGGPSDTGGLPLEKRDEVPWLEPMPGDSDSDTEDPATIVASRESMRLAFVAALQHLPAKQRAVLILRDVLAWRAAEVAELLGTTTAAVNSALQRARAQLDEVAPKQDDVVEPTTEDKQRLLARYVAAFERKDVDAIVALLAEDAVWEMPPFTTWFQGPEQVARHLTGQCPGGPGDFRFATTEANGEPALGMYLRAGDGVFRPFALQAFTVRGERYSHVVSFFDHRLFDTFGLPETL